MKKLIYPAALFLLAVCFGVHALAQCTPGDAISCPDPENNGAICPDSLPGGIAGQMYSQFFTILAPPEYPVNQTDTVPLHHITLIEVTNLPEGVTWQSNSPTNEFMVGSYYCVLLEGTPPAAGQYELKITVDVYAPPIFPNSPPLLLARITDSTSLFMEVTWDPNAVGDPATNPFTLIEPQPNPFSHITRIGYQTSEPGMARLNVYDLVGQLCYTEQVYTDQPSGYFSFDGSLLTKGMYILMVSNNQSAITRRLIKTE